MSDVLDVMFVAALVYALIVALRGARAYLALVGIAILGLVYLLARQLGLGLTAWLFQAFFAVFLIVLVVIFQEELRQIFERIAVWGLRRGRPSARADGRDELLVRTASNLASARRGALVVLPGSDPVERHVEGGIALDGRLSEPLLLSLFDPNSPGHDGAVIVEGDRVRRFATHLPLSASFEQLRMRGTRHAAALGLAERTDALCIVVSEERGRISIARDGQLRELGHPSELAAALADWSQGHAGAVVSPAGGHVRFLRENWRELGSAVVISGMLWALVIPGSEVGERSISVPVSLVNLPEGYRVDGIDPPEVELRVSGLRRDLFLLDPRSFEVPIDAFLVAMGRRTFELSPGQVRYPAELELSDLQPARVVLRVEKLPESGGDGGNSGATGETR